MRGDLDGEVPSRIYNTKEHGSNEQLQKPQVFHQDFSYEVIPRSKLRNLFETSLIFNINCLQHVNTQREPYLLYLGAPCNPCVVRAPNGRTEDLAFSDDSLNYIYIYIHNTLRLFSVPTHVNSRM